MASRMDGVDLAHKCSHIVLPIAVNLQAAEQGGGASEVYTKSLIIRKEGCDCLDSSTDGALRAWLHHGGVGLSFILSSVPSH